MNRCLMKYLRLGLTHKLLDYIYLIELIFYFIAFRHSAWQVQFEIFCIQYEFQKLLLGHGNA